MNINKLLCYSLIFGLMYACTEKEPIAYNSYLTFNHEFIEKTINVWLDDSECKNTRVDQFNIDMNSYYNHSKGSSFPEIQNPFFLPIDYTLNNIDNKSALDLKNILEMKTYFQDLTIKDSLTFTKHVIVKKDDDELINSTVELILYQISKEDTSTWILAKAILKDTLENSENVLLPTFKYNYQIKNDVIFSNFGYYYTVKCDNNYFKFPIELENIHVTNNEIVYENRTEKFLEILSENNYNISVEYK